MKTHKREYYLVNKYDGDTYRVIPKTGKAEQIIDGKPTGRIETTEILRNSDYKTKWVNA